MSDRPKFKGRIIKAGWKKDNPLKEVVTKCLREKYKQVSCASEEKMHKLHPGYVCDFMKKIFGINECLLTDESRFSDFDSIVPIEKAIAKVKKIYGENKTNSWIFGGGNPLIVDVLITLI